MEVKALTCDTYGTLVDWRGSILVVAKDMEDLARALDA